MTTVLTYRASLIEVKNLIDTYKKNKLTVVIFSLLFFAALLSVATLLLFKFTLTGANGKMSPALISMLSLLLMLVILAIGYWTIFNNPAVNKKRKVLHEKVSQALSGVNPRMLADGALIEDYKNQKIGEHALLNWVLFEMRATETL